MAPSAKSLAGRAGAAARSAVSRSASAVSDLVGRGPEDADSPPRSEGHESDPAASTATAKRTTAKKATAKTTAKKTTAKKTTAKKTTAKKTTAKKTTAKRSTAKRSAAKKSAAKKSAAKKSAAKKSAAKKSAAKKAIATTRTGTDAVDDQRPVEQTPAKQAPPARATGKSTKAARTTSTKKASAAATSPKTSSTTAAPDLVVLEKEDPWTEAELAEVRDQLVSDVQRLTEELAEVEGDLAGMIENPGEGAGHDQADVGSSSFERDQERQILNNARDMLEQSRHALDRIRDGSYGQCEACGNAIGKNRLMAFPRATLCLTCKQREERR